MNAAPRILVVDDESHMTYILCFKLQQAGAVTFSGASGLEGFEIACAELPDLIISDFQMPECDGLQFCKKLRAYGPTAEIPVILLTARGHRIPVKDLADTSVRYLMPKPFSVREILTKIGELLPDTALNAGSTAVTSAGEV